VDNEQAPQVTAAQDEWLALEHRRLTQQDQLPDVVGDPSTRQGLDRIEAASIVAFRKAGGEREEYVRLFLQEVEQDAQLASAWQDMLPTSD